MLKKQKKLLQALLAVWVLRLFKSHDTDKDVMTTQAHGKKYMQAREKVDTEKMYVPDAALGLVKELAHVKFDETVDVNINLGIDPAKGEQAVRGSLVLPHGTGKKIRIIVFAKGDYADQAKKAGADEIGAEDLVEKINGGWLDFDYAIATPDLMGLVGK